MRNFNVRFWRPDCGRCVGSVRRAQLLPLCTPHQSIARLPAWAALGHLFASYDPAQAGPCLRVHFVLCILYFVLRPHPARGLASTNVPCAPVPCTAMPSSQPRASLTRARSGLSWLLLSKQRAAAQRKVGGLPGPPSPLLGNRLASVCVRSRSFHCAVLHVCWISPNSPHAAC